MEASASIPPCDSGEIQLWICCPHVRFRQAKLATHDVGAFHHRYAFVVCDTPAEPFAAEAAISGDHQSFWRDELQSTTDQSGDIFRRLHDRVAVVHHADADLLVRLILAEQ